MVCCGWRHRLSDATEQARKIAVSETFGICVFAASGRLWWEEQHINLQTITFEFEEERNMQLVNNSDSHDEIQFTAKVAEVIRQFRLAAGLSPREFAEDIGTSPSFVIRMEAGQVDIDMRLLIRCAEALHTEPADLLLAASTGGDVIVLEEEEEIPKGAHDQKTRAR